MEPTPKIVRVEARVINHRLFQKQTQYLGLAYYTAFEKGHLRVPPRL